MPLTKANYKLPKNKKTKISEKLKKQQKRLEFERANLRGQSFLVHQMPSRGAQLSQVTV